MNIINLVNLQLKITSLSFLLLFLTGCSSFVNKGEGYPTQLNVSVKNSSVGQIDSNTYRRSEIIHNYLLGRFAYLHEDYDKAREHYEVTKNLITEPTPEIHAVLSELYLKEGELEKAEVEIEKALKLDAKNEQYRLLYAGILESLQKSEMAEAQYRLLLAQNENLAEPYILLAALYGKRRDFSESILLLKKFIELVPNNVVGQELLARFHEQAGEHGEAERVLEGILHTKGLTSQLFIPLARIYLRQEKNEEVKLLAKKMLEISPSNIVAKRILGELAISEGSVEQGLEYLRGAQSDSDGDVSSSALRYRIALLELQRQNHKAAERELLLVIAKDPKHYEAKYHLASIYGASDRKDDALEFLDSIPENSEMYEKAKTFAAFLLRQDKKHSEAALRLRKALSKQPENFRTRSYLALVLKDADKHSAAEEVLLEGLELTPNNETFLFQLAVLYSDQNDDEKALQLMEQVIELNPENSDALNFVAYSLAENMQSLERAEMLVRKALNIRKDDGYYLDTLGWILYLQQNYVAAKPILKKAVDVTDGDMVIMEHYGDVLMKLNDLTQAVEYYNRALVSYPEEDPTESQIKSYNRIKTKLKNLEKQ